MSKNYVITSKEIRDKFLSFFQENDHLLISDSSIIPKNDPTLLFINSGMAPLKKYFTGEETPPKSTLCNVQPCIRTIDIDEIGDRHHLTSFQMLGSWSINDYFKGKAIFLAFEFLTKYLKIPVNKLFATVFSGNKNLNLSEDDEAIKHWKDAGMPENHIVKCGMEDNFWGPTSETGPCGPCTEVFYDTGVGEEYVPGGIFDTKNRYIEIWNAGVFMQFNKNLDGTFSKLSFSSVDTGAGLERLSMALNNLNSVYETDLLEPIKDFIKALIATENPGNVPEKDVLILTDHLRTLTLILSERVAPSNEGRGYIPRKLIRKCMIILAKNGVNIDLSRVCEFIIKSYSDIFRLFETNQNYILSEIKKEQSQFEKILKNGLERLEKIKSQNVDITGEMAFELVATHGLPFEIIKNFSGENNIKLDAESYLDLITKHKEISKNLNKSQEDNLEKLFKKTENLPETIFTGYDNIDDEAEVLAILDFPEAQENPENSQNKKIVILDKTPAYAESGGQIFDIGVITKNNVKIDFTEVKKTKNKVFLHFCENFGTEILKPGDKIKVKIDLERRIKTRNNHTAVHLLHSALKNLLGKNVNQCGSKLGPDRLRLDFNYEKSITQEEIFALENLVNDYIRENFALETQIQDLSEALKSGATALFENKYSNKVRVVTFGNISKELCGGTHAPRTGDLGLFTILGVESIGKGIKRITGATGSESLKIIQNQTKNILEISKIFKTNPENLKEKSEKILEILENLKKLSKNSGLDASKIYKNLEQNIKFFRKDPDINLGFLTINSQEKNKDLINNLVDLSEKLNLILLCAQNLEDKTSLTLVLSKNFQKRFSAKDLLKKLLEKTDGKGGGSLKIASGSARLETQKIFEIFKNII